MEVGEILEQYSTPGGGGGGKNLRTAKKEDGIHLAKNENNKKKKVKGKKKKAAIPSGPMESENKFEKDGVPFARALEVRREGRK